MSSVVFWVAITTFFSTSGLITASTFCNDKIDKWFLYLFRNNELGLGDADSVCDII